METQQPPFAQDMASETKFTVNPYSFVAYGSQIAIMQLLCHSKPIMPVQPSRSLNTWTIIWVANEGTKLIRIDMVDVLCIYMTRDNQSQFQLYLARWPCSSANASQFNNVSDLFRQGMLDIFKMHTTNMIMCKSN